MNLINKDKLILNEAEKTLNKYLFNLNRKCTPKNRRVLSSMLIECVYDKDYAPYNLDMIMKFFYDRDIKKLLD